MTASSLFKWQEGMAEKKWDDQQTSAVTLRWDTVGGTISYSLKLHHVDEAAMAALTDPLDGGDARLPLSHLGMLQPQPEFHTLKHRIMESKNARWAEPVFRTCEFAFADFRAVAPDFDPTALVEVRFVFDRSERGVVLPDDVGLKW